MTPKNILEVNNLAVGMDGKTLFDQISFAIKPGELASLLGPSGSGKTTLLRAIAGLEPVTSGTISICGKICSKPGLWIPPEDRPVGVVFQNYGLFPHLTLAENIGFGISRLPKTQRREQIEALVDLVDLGGFENRYPHQLSGGQQQRTAIARTLARKPKLILLDEPFSNLDPGLSLKMRLEMRRILKKMEVAALLVTHHHEEAFDFADSVGVLNHGRLHQWGNLEEVYESPNSRETTAFLGIGDLIDLDSKELPDQQPPTISCSLGELSVELGGGTWETIKENGCCLLIRPEYLKVDSTSTIRATVESVTYRGTHRLLRLTLKNGDKIAAEVEKSFHPEIGDEVGIRYLQEKALLLPCMC